MSATAGTPSRPYHVPAAGITASVLGSLAAVMAAGSIALGLANRVSLLAALEEYTIPTVLVGITLAAVGTVIAMQRPALPLGWYLSGTALVCLVAPLAAQWARAALVTGAVELPAGAVAAVVAAFAWPVSAVLLFAGLPLVFPQGRPVGRIATAGGVVAVVALVLMSLGSGFSAGPSANLPEIPDPAGVVADWPAALQSAGLLLVLVAMLLAAAALVLRYRRSDPPDRVRIRAFVAAALLLVGSETVLPAMTTALIGSYPDWLDSLAETVFGAGLVLAVGVAVLRHHLHGIDVVVNRGAVYVVMTAVVTTVYVVVVGYSSLALGARGTGPEIVATVLAALCFEPVRRRVQTGMNRLFYGQREDPERLIARLDRRLDGTESVESLLAAVAETARTGLRLPFVAATVVGEDGAEIGVARGSATGPVVPFPVVAGSRLVGSIAVQPRASERGLAERDRRALLDYSAHAAPALWAARMSGELLGARARLLAARENERSRLRRDLHDGLGADLGSQVIMLDAVRRLVREDPARAERLLLEAREHMQAAVTDLRRTLDDLRPAVLDDHGLAAALRALVDRHAEAAMAIELHVDLPIEPPAAVQTAAFRIVSEALSNSVRHSRGGACRIEVSGTATSIRLRVQDDGHGLGSASTPGVGLRSIRERAAELGGSAITGSGEAGGALVTAMLPFGEG